jgi:hypothetical protein
MDMLDAGFMRAICSSSWAMFGLQLGPTTLFPPALLLRLDAREEAAGAVLLFTNLSTSLWYFP